MELRSLWELRGAGSAWDSWVELVGAEQTPFCALQSTAGAAPREGGCSQAEQTPTALTPTALCGCSTSCIPGTAEELGCG